MVVSAVMTAKAATTASRVTTWVVTMLAMVAALVTAAMHAGLMSLPAAWLLAMRLAAAAAMVDRMGTAGSRALMAITQVDARA